VVGNATTVFPFTASIIVYEPDGKEIKDVREVMSK